MQSDHCDSTPSPQSTIWTPTAIISSTHGWRCRNCRDSNVRCQSPPSKPRQITPRPNKSRMARRQDLLNHLTDSKQSRDYHRFDVLQQKFPRHEPIHSANTILCGYRPHCLDGCRNHQCRYLAHHTQAWRRLSKNSKNPLLAGCIDANSSNHLQHDHPMSFRTTYHSTMGIFHHAARCRAPIPCVAGRPVQGKTPKKRRTPVLTVPDHGAPGVSQCDRSHSPEAPAGDPVTLPARWPDESDFPGGAPQCRRSRMLR